MGADKKQTENVNLEFMKYPHYRVPNEIHDIGLRTSEIAVYVVLCRYCNPGITAWPSYTAIAKKAGCSRPTATKAVKRLIKIGLLNKTRRRIGADKMNSNLYEVNHDIQGQYLKLAPDKHDTNPDNLESGKARLLSVVKELYRGSKGGLLDKELPIKNYDYKELSTGSKQDVCPTVSFNEYKKHNRIDDETIDAIDYYLHNYKKYTGKEHMKLKPETWEHLVDTILFIDNDDPPFDIEINSIVEMVDHYFTKEYNNGDCNRCITHFNDPGIKKVNFFEAAY